jgi:GT2 family glycosyltransferase
VSAPAVVIPNWNGARWLPGCLASLAQQTLQPAETVVVDNGSTDGSLELLRDRHPDVRVVELGRNTGFAFAANRGIEAAASDFVALVNTDVELEPDWIERMTAALDRDPVAAAVACKMLELDRRDHVYDAGDVLRRDGACEQRGRFRRDDGRYDEPGYIFAACAGAAVYRREAVLALGGFDERFFAYLEDVDLGLRLRLAGWSCLYEPAVAYHASEGSSGALSRPVLSLVERNTLLLVAKAFPLRWLPFVLYRQLGWAWHALREGRLRAQLGGALSALPLMPAMLRERRALRASAVVPVEVAVPSRPIRGPRAGGHPRAA